MILMFMDLVPDDNDYSYDNDFCYPCNFSK